MFAHLRRWHFGSGNDIAYVSLDTPWNDWNIAQHKCKYQPAPPVNVVSLSFSNENLPPLWSHKWCGAREISLI